MRPIGKKIMEFEIHKGPLLAGELIVIEINGEIVSKKTNDSNPQWFVVLKNQTDNESVPIKPFDNPTSLHKAKKYIALWGM